MLHVGNCIDVISQLPDASVDSVVTDPPYELGFMGKSWDSTGIAYNTELWRQCLRVLKPGGHLIAFSGARTYHRMAVAIEDAGFEIRDQIMWVYGSGFPKSLNISKAIDKMVGADREVVGVGTSGKTRHVLNAANTPDTFGGEYEITKAASEEAKRWEGWGTALKPAHEPMVLARKPLDGTVAENVLEYGTGALNIDATRIPFGEEQINLSRKQRQQQFEGGIDFGASRLVGTEIPTYKEGGRWPANFIHDGSEEVLELFPDAKGGTWNTTKGARHFNNNGKPTDYQTKGQDKSNGSAARFFYCAKASSAERNLGLDELPDRRQDEDDYERAGTTNPRNRSQKMRKNHHPTVKPVALMRHLVKLVTPPDGTVLDPFLGSGTTAVAATLEGINWVGCEMNEEYAEIISARVAHARNSLL